MPLFSDVAPLLITDQNIDTFKEILSMQIWKVSVGMYSKGFYTHSVIKQVDVTCLLKCLSLL